MAESVVVVSITQKWDDGAAIHVTGALTIGANPGTYTTSGIAFNPNGVITDARPGFVPLPGITAQPIVINIDGMAGFKYEFDAVNKKLLIRQSVAASSALAEIPAAGMPAGVSGDTIRFYGIWRKNI